MRARRNILEVLQDFRKPDLADIGDLFGRQMSLRMRKAEMVRELAVYLTGSPARWLDLMLERDLMLLSRLVDRGPNCRLSIPFPDYPTVLELAGIVEWDDSDKEFHQVWLRDEMWRIVRPHVAGAIRKGRESGRFELERLCIGYANLYGVVPQDLFLDRLCDYCDQARSGQYATLSEFLKSSPFLKFCRLSLQDDADSYVFTPVIDNAETILHQRESFGEELDFAVFSPEEAIDAGGDAPYFFWGRETDAGKALLRLLEQLGCEGEELLFEAHEIWMCAQDPDSYPALFNVLFHHCDRIPSESEYEHCLGVIAAYANACPKWLLKGHSADETGLLAVQPDLTDLSPEEAGDSGIHWEMPRPTISEGYSDLIETDDRLDAVLSLMPQGFPFGMAIPHVAGTDPCPCGSGLQYAHCHGRFKS